jgi:hypothetical protein
MVVLSGREYLGLAVLLWEEGYDWEPWQEYFDRKWVIIEERAYHDDEKAWLAYDLYFLERDVGKSEFSILPEKRDRVHQMCAAFHIVDWFLFDCSMRRDVDGFLNAFLKLPHKFRRDFIERLDSYTRGKLRGLVGDEIYELLGKAKVEVKVVLSVEEVVPLIIKYGRDWREKVRELISNVIQKL